MMDFEIWKHRHEEMVCEVELNSLARSLRLAADRRGRDPRIWLK